VLACSCLSYRRDPSILNMERQTPYPTQQLRNTSSLIGRVSPSIHTALRSEWSFNALRHLEAHSIKSNNAKKKGRYESLLLVTRATLVYIETPLLLCLGCYSSSLREVDAGHVLVEGAVIHNFVTRIGHVAFRTCTLIQLPRLDCSLGSHRKVEII